MYVNLLFAIIMKHITPKAELVKAAALDGYQDIITSYGLDYARVLHDVNLSIAELSNPNLLIRYEQFIDLLNYSADKTSNPHFGLELGSKQGLSIFGTLGYVIKNSLDLRGALKELANFYHHEHHSSANIELKVDGPLAKLSFEINSMSKKSLVQASELPLAAGFNILKTLTNGTLKVKQFTLPHSRPDNISAYAKILGQVPIFNAETIAVYFDAQFLNYSFKQADPALLKILESNIASDDLVYADEIPPTVERIIHHELTSGDLSLEKVAAKFAMSARTLQRHLKEQDTSYRKLVDKVRSKLARHYLVDSSLSLIEIATILQYSNYSEFTRAFKRLNKVTPRDYRKKNAKSERLSRPIRVRR